MRRTLGTLLTCAVLAGVTACGSAGSSTATDGSSSPSAGSTLPYTAKTLISVTGAGGTTSVTATRLDTDAQVTSFARQFNGDAMLHRIQAFQRREDGQVPGGIYGAVVAVGCDRPPGVDVLQGADGTVQIVPHEVASPLPECLAAVTTVALVVLQRP